MGVEGVEVVQHPRHSPRVVEDYDTAGTGHGAAGCQGVEIQRDVPKCEFSLCTIGILEFKNLVGFEYLGGGSAGDDCLDLAAILRTAAHVVEQLTHRHLADLDLEGLGIFLDLFTLAILAPFLHVDDFSLAAAFVARARRGPFARPGRTRPRIPAEARRLWETAHLAAALL